MASRIFDIDLSFAFCMNLLAIADYCDFSKDCKCIEWMDYQSDDVYADEKCY